MHLTKNQAGCNENPGPNDGANEKVEKIAQPDRADEVGHLRATQTATEQRRAQHHSFMVQNCR